ncbi:MAG: glutaredoxin family protein [Pseudomonadota bacterium]
MIQFTLYSRSYCHLCDDMLEALQTVLDSYGAGDAFAVKVVDVDADEALVARYDELVPVLVGKKGDGAEQQICHYFLDHAKLKDFLS